MNNPKRDAARMKPTAADVHWPGACTVQPHPNVPEAWVVEFDWRSDDGPNRVGPFESRAQALSWLDTVDCDYDGATAVKVDKP